MDSDLGPQLLSQTRIDDEIFSCFPETLGPARFMGHSDPAIKFDHMFASEYEFKLLAEGTNRNIARSNDRNGKPYSAFTEFGMLDKPSKPRFTEVRRHIG